MHIQSKHLAAGLGPFILYDRAVPDGDATHTSIARAIVYYMPPGERKREMRRAWNALYSDDHASAYHDLALILGSHVAALAAQAANACCDLYDHDVHIKLRISPQAQDVEFWYGRLLDLLVVDNLGQNPELDHSGDPAGVLTEFKREVDAHVSWAEDAEDDDDDSDEDGSDSEHEGDSGA